MTDRDLLKRVVKRWNELQDRVATTHDFACLVYSIEEHLDSPTNSKGGESSGQ